MSISTPTTGVRAYLLAAFAVGLALILRMRFDPLWGDRLPYAWFFLAVLLVARFAGTGPQIFTLLAGMVLGDWFFLQPRHSLLITSQVDQVNTMIFGGVGLLVMYFSARARRALARELAAHGRVAAIVESSDDAIIGESKTGWIVTWNAAAARLYGYTSEEVVGRSFSMLFPAESSAENLRVLERVRRGERVSHYETVQRTAGGALVDVSLTISPVQTADRRITGISITARDVSERKRAEAERERLIKELQAALAEVKNLSGLLPICAHCKKIRDDQGSWNQIETYIRERSNANFSHGICPDCAHEHFPSLYQ